MRSTSAVPELPASTEVLIVGAGPAGLTLAASLRQLGVDFVLIDRNTSVQPGSKAAAVQPRTLEYLERIGVSDTLVATGVRSPGFSLHDRERTLLRATFAELDTPFPYVSLVSQQTTEEHLLRRLLELGGTVHRDHRFIGFSTDFPGVSVTVAGPDGALQAISARYLVGCDGVRSAVRTAAGIGFPGQAHEQLFTIADVRLSAAGQELVAHDTTFFLSGAGMLLFSPLAGEQYRVVSPAPPGQTEPTPSDVQRLLTERGPQATVTEVIRASTYRVQERVAEQFRNGPVLLVGDAAHTHSPAGAQGMNTGIQDAGNLAWKLHAVLTGAAGDELLDSYHAERHPVAAEMVAFTALFAKMASVRDPVAARLRNGVLAAAASAPGATDWIATKLSELDVSYANGPACGLRVGDRVPPTVVPGRDLRWTLAVPETEDLPQQRRNLGVRHVPDLDEALLVRPDGYLFACGKPTELLDHLPTS
ncbi:FAD-dependent monooxygenase [Kribbella kalugense]|uniref:2-polyprenyl-6-methoxyphenol hydroxylase-like FAD-dependent oxidoreductase n=1 Tax=Kribbella kalugense TaxID=2512221 RepID=A0A4V3G8V2_9ACTN|nr:FAD-dependent monooxygenase [Kribbella kalugense]TDW24364.1 2-polyprenyl-6-methoxyphenol hydroxylase-like FAD-dependent oxidoreductase [Kribbella kalugense]